MLIIRNKIGKLCIALLAFQLPIILDGQVLLELQDNSRHQQVAEIYKQNNIKQISHEYDVPFLPNDPITLDSTTLKWKTKTIIFSEFYLRNGLINEEKQSFKSGKIYDSKKYEFDITGNLIKTIEINNQQVRSYDFQMMTYHYGSGKLYTIEKIRSKHKDTTKTLTTFSYSGERLDKVIEKDIKTGDTLLSSFFSYPIKENYIAEESFILDFCQVRTTYYYTLDPKGRIVKVSCGVNGYEKDLYPIREISYDFSKEIPADNAFFKIEKYK